MLIGAVAERSTGQLLLAWLLMTIGLGLAYWTLGLLFRGGIQQSGHPIPATPDGLATALYFSFVTALSIGYGDVVPTGWIRLLAIAEGAAGLLIFGMVISKLVSRHQEQVLEEMHRIAFEDRLGRVRSNLHLVLSDLEAISARCADPDTRPEQVVPRLESAVGVFEGELSAIHDLLYRPQQVPEEGTLESILANLAAGFQELEHLLKCMPPQMEPSRILRRNLHALRVLADEICGECVPNEYAPNLKAWMDRIQEQGRRLETRV